MAFRTSIFPVTAAAISAVRRSLSSAIAVSHFSMRRIDLRRFSVEECDDLLLFLFGGIHIGELL